MARRCRTLPCLCDVLSVLVLLFRMLEEHQSDLWLDHAGQSPTILRSTQQYESHLSRSCDGNQSDEELKEFYSHGPEKAGRDHNWPKTSCRFDCSTRHQQIVSSRLLTSFETISPIVHHHRRANVFFICRDRTLCARRTMGSSDEPEAPSTVDLTPVFEISTNDR